MRSGYLSQTTCAGILRVSVLVVGSPSSSSLASGCWASQVVVAAFLRTRLALLLSVLNDSVQDFLGDFTALAFVVLTMINKIDVGNEERDNNEGRNNEGRNNEGKTNKYVSRKKSADQTEFGF